MSGDHMVTTVRLTKRVVENLPAKAERFVVWDTELKGFGVRVSSQGRKTSLVRYRTTDGADRRLTLATHGVRRRKKHGNSPSHPGRGRDGRRSPRA